MNIIKITTAEGKKAIINIANISFIIEASEGQTTIALVDSQDFLKVNMTIEDFEKMLRAETETID